MAYQQDSMAYQEDVNYITCKLEKGSSKDLGWPTTRWLRFCMEVSFLL